MFARIVLCVATFGPSNVCNQQKGLFVSFQMMSISLSRVFRLMSNRCRCTHKNGKFRCGKVRQTSVPLSHVTKSRCYATKERSSERGSLNLIKF